MKDNQFNFYEIAGIIIPGAVTLIGLFALFPEFKSLIFSKSITVGEFGIFLILAYPAGHVIQAPGNLLETIVWAVSGGWPTDRVRNEKGNILSLDQVKLLEIRLSKILNLDKPLVISTLTQEEWSKHTGLIKSIIEKHGMPERVISFNRIYGMCRGIAAALLVISIIYVIADWTHWKIALIPLIAALLLIFRMCRFGFRYGKELYRAFLALPEVPVKTAEVKHDL